MTKSNVPKKSWRDVMPIHPAADLFPLMTAEEFEAFVEDIRKNGLRPPYGDVVHRHGDRQSGCVLLDGRNRLDAAEAVGQRVTMNDDAVISIEGKAAPITIRAKACGRQRRAVD